MAKLVPHGQEIWVCSRIILTEDIYFVPVSTEHYCKRKHALYAISEEYKKACKLENKSSPIIVEMSDLKSKELVMKMPSTMFDGFDSYDNLAPDYIVNSATHVGVFLDSDGVMCADYAEGLFRVNAITPKKYMKDGKEL